MTSREIIKLTVMLFILFLLFFGGIIAAKTFTTSTVYNKIQCDINGGDWLDPSVWDPTAYGCVIK